MPNLFADVLVVDDNRLLREVVSRLLQEVGYEVIEAAHGLEAWHILQRIRCRVVLTDCWMPHMSGPELFEHIRSRWPETQVVFMSEGKNDLAPVVLMRGAHAWLEKPFGDNLLLITIKTAHQYARITDQNGNHHGFLPINPDESNSVKPTKLTPH